jgi:hypothetical protein
VSHRFTGGESRARSIGARGGSRVELRGPSVPGAGVRRLHPVPKAGWSAFWGKPRGPICYVYNAPAVVISEFVGWDYAGDPLTVERFRCPAHEREFGDARPPESRGRD